MKLGLGTVQFGMAYGISNRQGQVSSSEIEAVLRRARSADIQILDTAPAYGLSQQALGQARAGESGFEIVTKTPTDGDTSRWRSSLEASLRELRVDSMRAWLAHRAGDLFGPRSREALEVMRQAKADGLVKKIGASVYSVDELQNLFSGMGGDAALDLIQLPASIFDRRMLRSGWLNQLRDLGVEIHVRSAFLQGLLFMEGDQLPGPLAGAAEVLSRVKAVSLQYGVRRSALALGYLKSLGLVDVVLCGVTSVSELDQLIEDFTSNLLPEITWDSFEIRDESILNPSQWATRGKNA